MRGRKERELDEIKVEEWYGRKRREVRFFFGFFFFFFFFWGGGECGEGAKGRRTQHNNVIHLFKKNLFSFLFFCFFFF